MARPILSKLSYLILSFISIGRIFNPNLLHATTPAQQQQKKSSPRLSRAQVIEIAKSVPIQYDMNASRYKPASVLFHKGDRSWFVLFVPIKKSDKYVGNHYGISVNDIDGATRFVPGM